MTNKPMLSVGLRKALADFIEYSVPGPRSDDAMWYKDKQELRTFLDSRSECRCKRYGKDNPNWPCPVHAESAAQHQGGVTLEQVLKAYDYANSHPHRYLRGTTNWCAAVAHALNVQQLAPVSDHPQCEECKGWGYHENHYEGGGTECGDCGGSGNATVSLVMPERLNTEGGYSLEAETWYSLALDDVASLNGVTK